MKKPCGTDRQIRTFHFQSVRMVFVYRESAFLIYKKRSTQNTHFDLLICILPRKGWKYTQKNDILTKLKQK